MKTCHTVLAALLMGCLMPIPLALAENPRATDGDKPTQVESESLSTESEQRSDTWLKASIVTAFTLNRHLNPFEITTDVQSGKVTLSGEVDESIDKDLAEEIAKSFVGVTSVANNITVAVKDPAKRTATTADSIAQRINNATITASVKSKLLWNKHTQGTLINVDTENGIVTLHGDVSSSAEKDLAEKIAANATDVRRVENKLTVSGKKGPEVAGVNLAEIGENTSAALNDVAKDLDESIDGQKVQQNARGALSTLNQNVSDSWITTKARSTLLLSSEASGSDVDISTVNGVVTLSGKVRNTEQKEQIEDTVSSLVGVKSAINKLEVAVP